MSVQTLGADAMSDTTAASGSRLRPTSVGGVLIVLASVVTSVAAVRPLGDRIRIRWTVGEHYHLGPEHAPTVAALVAFPIAVACTYVCLRWLGHRLEHSGGFDGDRIYYELAALGTLALLLVVQLALVAANLVAG